ncbi:tRNA pseudouridine(55) synthase TruB [Carbonactinospora thermoautotrophica]|uniref:tRNA pseudouridine synthase B n=1 Tax=Carbonactinospora thermoautotrophica TaxID=1469144 RepID=A0A132MPB4_9ACTN|nr:tRNA pseudouridine(55) synthase TruB [Carbonactinospora thermoautotrophica]KWW99707.1 tRNA pseudouridine synthase B [Carbonactinospora thermoautotrophica]KWX04520.1 tRNA pseudouridine synthase B [Carbonactinospora thermoautotrophica]KWX08563.1 tRNA pseudouridine synthase B [Carbonactinospora thermoautotrophica]MCX9191287.1 tRNA pseudouridine(55) synthase TruB [Carbonactinospora thermoautotrophica]
MTRHQDRTPPLDGLVVVDKPAGWTSHDVVAKIRKIAGTRRVGHAGTLDPMATGVLVLGIGRATRLLGHLALTEKAYDATIRLGQSTTTDDAEGEVLATHPATGLDRADIEREMAALTGEIRQVPSTVSAIKIGGRRAYARARAGEEVELEARPVTVRVFELRAMRAEGEFLDLDVSVVCSSGTYVRALARDLGAALGVGGHLTMLRRTRVGPYTLEHARTLDELAESFQILPLAAAVAAAFPRRDVGPEEARRIAHGGWLKATGLGPGPVAVFGPGDQFLALVEETRGQAKPIAVFVP